MTVQHEEIEYCKVKVHYTAAPGLVEEKKVDAVDHIKRSKIKIPGFRMGKATDLAIRVNMGDFIENYVKRELVAEAYDETLFETKMKPIGYPEVDSTKLEGSHFECDMTFRKKPEFELKQYKGLSIPSPHLEMTAAEGAEQMLQELRVLHGDIATYGDDDFVQDGDKVTLDVKVSVDGKTVDKLSSDGLLYTVGENSVPEFDHNLFGMKPGEERKFDIVFDDEAQYTDEVRNKRATFEVKIHMGTKTIPCALDDEFAKKLNFESFDKLRHDAEGSASARLAAMRKQRIMAQVMKQIVANHDFQVPEWLTLGNAQREAQARGIDWDSLSDDNIDILLEQSEEQVKMSLIMDEIRDDDPDASFSEQELIDKLRGHLESQGKDAKQIVSSAAADGSLIGILAAMKDELTMSWLVDQSTVINEDEVPEVVIGDEVAETVNENSEE
jgi:trigger factor